MYDSVQPHRRQPTRLPSPWDSPGKNTGVGCHFILQCRKVKSESEAAQLCPTLSDPMDCSLPGSSAHGIFQARVLEWGAIAFSVVCVGQPQKNQESHRMLESYTAMCVDSSWFSELANPLPHTVHKPRGQGIICFMAESKNKTSLGLNFILKKKSSLISSPSSRAITKLKTTSA